MTPDRKVSAVPTATHQNIAATFNIIPKVMHVICTSPRMPLVPELHSMLITPSGVMFMMLASLAL